MTNRTSSLADLSDDELVTHVEELSLAPELFSHLGHLRLAFIYLERLPLEQAAPRICESIRAFAAHLGAQEKYNRTLTEAMIRIMHARRGADPTRSFEAFLAANQDLVRDARGLLRRHYSDERLTSESAHTAFLVPDREPLPTLPERTP